MPIGRLIAIIPARSGSKGLPGKNLRVLAGKPLLQHAIDAARDSGQFEQIVVTSDDEEVLALAGRLGAVTLRRCAGLASDTTTMNDVVNDLQRKCGPLGDAFALLQPTSPLRTADHIAQCVSQFAGGQFASAVSVCAMDHPPQKAIVIVDGLAEPLLGWRALHANRQALAPAYRQNGAIWIVTWDAFRQHRSFVVSPAMPFIMKAADSIDIDTLDDFNRAEAAFAQRTHDFY